MASPCYHFQTETPSANCDGQLAVDAQSQKCMGICVQQYNCTSVRRSGRGAAAPRSERCLHPPPGADFEVPALHCSFPILLHPQYEVVKEQTDGWILDVAQPPSAASRLLLLDCLLPRLICRTIPTASSVTRLVHVTKMVAWLTLSDDDDDNPETLGSDDVSTAEHASQVLTILRRIPSAAAGCHGEEAVFTCKRKEKREAALLALAALWAEMVREMSPHLCSRFLSTMEDYFDAVRVQAAYRKASRLPDIQAYKETRRHASFILPCFVLLEYALDIELDDATYADQRIQEFRNAAADYICLCNDLISCKVEIRQGDYFNMPSIVYASKPANSAWTMQKAVDCVADMAHKMDSRCVSMLQTMFREDIPKKAAAGGLTSASPFATELARTYVSSLLSCMSGSLAWYLESARYASK